MVLVQEYKSPNLALTPLIPLLVLSKLAFLLGSLLGTSYGCCPLVLKHTLLCYTFTLFCYIPFKFHADIIFKWYRRPTSSNCL